MIRSGDMQADSNKTVPIYKSRWELGGAFSLSMVLLTKVLCTFPGRGRQAGNEPVAGHLQIALP